MQDVAPFPLQEAVPGVTPFYIGASRQPRHSPTPSHAHATPGDSDYPDLDPAMPLHRSTRRNTGTTVLRAFTLRSLPGRPCAPRPSPPCPVRYSFLLCASVSTSCCCLFSAIHIRTPRWQLCSKKKEREKEKALLCFPPSFSSLLPPSPRGLPAAPLRRPRICLLILRALPPSSLSSPRLASPCRARQLF